MTKNEEIHSFLKDFRRYHILPWKNMSHSRDNPRLFVSDTGLYMEQNGIGLITVAICGRYISKYPRLIMDNRHFVRSTGDQWNFLTLSKSLLVACRAEPTVQQTVKLPVIGHVMLFMYHYCNGTLTLCYNNIHAYTHSARVQRGVLFIVHIDSETAT